MNKAIRPFRIGISGSYGGMNLGDESILHSIISQLRKSLKTEITVYTHDTEDTLKRHCVERAIKIYELTRDEARAEIGKLDLFILGGGGILYDGDAQKYLREISFASELNIPIMVYAISAGPLTVPSIRNLVAERLNSASVITVRDHQSKKILEEVNVEREIITTADPALLLEPEALPEEILKSEGLDSKNLTVGFSVREPGPAAPDIDVNHYHALLANAADFMVDRYNADIVFVPMERKMMDMQQSHGVISKMQCAQRATVLRGQYTPSQMLSLVKNFKFSVGMRLHFLIFSAIAGVPFVALPYASKVESFLKDLDMSMPPFDQVTTGRLIAYIDYSWDFRNELREKMKNKLPFLKAQAEKNNHILIELIKKNKLQNCSCLY